MAQTAIGGLFGVCDLGDELWGQPDGRSAGLGRRIRIGAGLARQIPGFVGDQTEGRVVESGADPAPVDEGAADILAEQQRRERPAPLVGFSVPGDDELAAADALGFHPCGSAAGAIDRVRPLRDDTLEVHRADPCDEPVARSSDMVAERKDADARVQYPPQSFLPVNQCVAPEIQAIEKQQIEREIQKIEFIRFPRFVQKSEVGAAVTVERDEFAVDDGAVHVEHGQCVGDDGVAVRPVVGIARHQPRLSLMDERLDAVSVELDLVQPVLAAGRLVTELGQLRRDEGRFRGPRGTRSRRWPARFRLCRPPSARIRRFQRLCLRPGVFVLLDGREVASRLDAGRPIDRRIALLVGIDVALLDQEPVFPLLPLGVLHADKRETALQPLAIERKFESACVQTGGRIALGCPPTPIPQHDRPGAVSCGNDPLEFAIVDRMILGPDREPLDGGIEAWPLRHRPALQDAIEFQAEVIVQPPRVMLLHDEEVPLRLFEFAGWLRRASEVALLPVRSQRMVGARHTSANLPCAWGICFGARASLPPVSWRTPCFLARRFVSGLPSDR